MLILQQAEAGAALLISRASASFAVHAGSVHLGNQFLSSDASLQLVPAWPKGQME